MDREEIAEGIEQGVKTNEMQNSRRRRRRAVKSAEAFRRRAKGLALDALDRLGEIATDPQSAAQHAIPAGKAIIEYAYGKPGTQERGATVCACSGMGKSEGRGCGRKGNGAAAERKAKGILERAAASLEYQVWSDAFGQDISGLFPDTEEDT